MKITTLYGKILLSGRNTTIHSIIHHCLINYFICIRILQFVVADYL